jgi:antitoxin HicB
MDNKEAIRGYPIRIGPLPDELGGGYEAWFAPLARSVVGYGETPEAAVSDLMEAVPAFLQLMEETGQSLPEPAPPRSRSDYSGRFNVRVPKALHAKLVRLAEEHGVSLNALVMVLLAWSAAALEADQDFGLPASDVSAFLPRFESGHAETPAARRPKRPRSGRGKTAIISV